MKKFLVLLCVTAFLLGGCGSGTDANHPQTQAPQTQSGNTAAANKTTGAVSAQDNQALAQGETTDDYVYDLQADRAKYDLQKIDIKVGDKLYMTQINDWFKNFEDYAGKTVAIEGYYLHFNNKYTFVGRKGPTCPYCVGGYVDFEFKGDQDMSHWETGKTWIRVVGILRAGRYLNKAGKPLQPFYYIEALQVTKLPQAGLGTITN
ncbi:MAG: hypothetical protein LKF34_07290 [Acidaminococcaceae bacterium]|nr:hypothetical protein [Acidaminococcaceae bacterium]